MLEAGCKIDLTNNHGRTPLHLAASKGHEKVVELLLSKGASTGFKDNNGISAQRLAAENCQTSTPELINSHEKAVDLKEISTNPTSDNSSHVQHQIVPSKRINLIPVSQARGVDPNSLLETDDTILHLAVRANRKDVINFMLNVSGVNGIIPSIDLTSLEVAWVWQML
ncbi:hypothetical protein THRCLA_20136 [Thraustotheca clavata]|uniref:Uncharacterized protein n=1 Tax=Thraustotheca clavata TaxID=74557 RepID=A0A1W0AB40_9STRA|nr:hypothetical protein THRCLA_20136 [Thraustotheca clavata]